MKKTKVIRYTSFTVGVVTLGCGVVFLFTENAVPSIVCLTIGVIASIFSFLPYPFLKEEENQQEEEDERFR